MSVTFRSGLDGVSNQTIRVRSSSAAGLAATLDERTRMVWFETPSNPLLKVTDIASVAGAAHAHAGARGEPPIVVVDNTFASPALQRPLALGADVVFHSATCLLYTSD